ncbi:hypothetical protein DFH07DRAFT_749135 [Mycena maculata]|uniref:Uncharacterized protein n=1 Tax=Mycena maculata TaxID=230809 RepID=A0AAD7IK59_9AGAR|nr:hypothetical protein DFH07DRAFT_749135 [Mycena maculata]
MWLVGLAPALLHGILPDPYWRHFCKGVNIIQCFHQHKIPTEQIIERHKLAIEYIVEFETLYFQGMPERIHFVRQSVHVMSHLGPEVIRLGPASLYSQWTMERTIGNLGQEIKSDSQPYTNLSERGLRRSQVNALKAMIPGLDPKEKESLPRGSIELGNNFVLLRPRDEFRHQLYGEEAEVIKNFLGSKDDGPNGGKLSLARWARLRLPNGQIARSRWKEIRRPLDKVRMARNVKVSSLSLSKEIAISEVHFFFRAEVAGLPQAFALVDLYSQPDEDFIRESHSTVWSCGHGEGKHLRVIPAQSILSVVAMVPHDLAAGAAERYRPNNYFLVEKPGLDIMQLVGYEQADDPDDSVDAN